ncbi:M16 family metallopeptidase [Prevotella sp.]
MTVSRLCSFLIAVWISVLSLSAQTPDEVIPMDPAVRVGKLENGLTYYIKHSTQAIGRANFYIVQKVGAMQEEDSQLGLAHFLEHMCFKGTKHFEGNRLISYCESLGLQFGTDLNATTRLDETFYQVCNVPIGRQSTLDSCLLILHDWAGALTLNETDINHERNVIYEEWRMRNSASKRLVEKNLPRLFPNSRYGQRTVMGSMDIVRSFKPNELRDYYRKWYRPANQALVIVGDVNVDNVEAAIRKMFSSLRNPISSPSVTLYPVFDNQEPIVVIDKDKELKTSHVKLFVKYGNMPDSMNNRVRGMMENYALNAAIFMVNKRLAERAEHGSCPFIRATLKDGDYINAKTKKALELSVVPKEAGMIALALKAAVTEVRRAMEYGFTVAEYADCKKVFGEELIKSVGVQDNQQVFESCKAHFLEGTVFPSTSYLRNVFQKVIPSVSRSTVNKKLSDVFSLDGCNMVIVNFNRELPNVVYPTADELLNAVKTARQEKLLPYEEKVKRSKELELKEIEAGTIIKESQNKDFGYTKLTLSNGATVLLKKTNIPTQPIVFRAEGKGGATAYGIEDLPQIKLFNYALQVSGLGNLTALELSKWLAGKHVKAQMGMDNLYTSISGSAELNDVETLFQLVHTCLTDIHRDDNSFNNLIAQLKSWMETSRHDPDRIMTDSINATLYQHDPWQASLTMSDLEKADYQRILQIVRERTCDMSQWTFFITGSFDDAKVRQLLCHYIASIRSKATSRNASRPLLFQKNKVENIFTCKMQVPKTNAYVVWHHEKLPYTLKNAIQMELIGQMLSATLLEKIRQQTQAAYTCEVRGEVTLAQGYPIYTLAVVCPMKPGMEKQVLQIINDEVVKMAKKIDVDLLNKVKAYTERRFSSGVQGNGYWDDIIYKHYRYGQDGRANYAHLVAAQTEDDILQFMKAFLRKVNKATIVMKPE